MHFKHTNLNYKKNIKKNIKKYYNKQVKQIERFKSKT